MNDLSNEALREQNPESFKPIPRSAIYILVPLFLMGLSVSIFILIAVHNASFFLSFLFLSAFVASFLAWNTCGFKHKVAPFYFLHSFPDSDLAAAAHEGQLVKITGLASCGSVSLESSYERTSRCIYTSTILYEYGGFEPKPTNASVSCFKWSSTYCERFSTDFYVTDQKSGIRAMVKAGSGSKVVPLIVETALVTTTRQCKVLSPYLRKWLRERNLSTEPRTLRLEEGYVNEGSFVTVIGVLRRSNGIWMIVEPPEVLSTGCLWQKLLFPVDIDGLVVTVPNMGGPVMNPHYRLRTEQQC